MATRVLELTAAACVANGDVAMVNRRDAAVASLSAKDNVARRVKGLAGRTANLGFIVGLVGGNVAFTVDMATMNGQTAVKAVDIPVPAGKELAVYAHSTNGTAVATLDLVYDEPD